ncbi:MAG TPA: hypothetical protein VMJ10_18905 [Kofleriaceae bacterium]|nr:hypothetical protein [Kofleriaceae bacterium]
MNTIRSSLILSSACALAAACGSSNNTKTPDAPVSTADGGLNPLGSFDPGFTPTSPNTPLSIEVTISGETLGENGLPFTPINVGDPQFVDGWSVSFEKYIVVIGNVRLSPNATQYSNQQQLNTIVATKPGPYAIDVHQLATDGFNGFVGADGEEPAGGIFKWDTQDDGTAFDSGTLYAFSYDTVPAQYPATQVNFTKDDEVAYAEMVKNHWNKYIEARATFVATGKYPNAAIESKFESLAGGVYDTGMQAYTTPPQVHFIFGWNDATSSINCINPFNGDMDEANLANRGVQPNTNGATIAQVTIHTDHVFWDKLKQEGTPLRMDHIAAWAGADTNTTPLDLGSLGTKPLALTFSDGTPLPDRAPYLNNPTGTFTSDQTDPTHVTLDLNGVTASDISGLSAFMAFSAQSQTHLNANGLCYIVGQNASDPFYDPVIAPGM